MANQSTTKKPSRPTIDTVTDNVEPHTGVIGQAGLTNDPRPVLNGHGEAGSVIHIRVDNQEVGTVRVGPHGTWTFRLPEPLSDGLFRLSVRASNASGQSLPSAAYLIEVDVTPPLRPAIDSVSSDGSAQLSGHAEPYSTVDVYDGNTFLGTATTGADSSWTFTLPSGMAAGSHALTVKATDPAGNTSEVSDGFDYVVAPDRPTARAVVDDAGRDSGLYHDDWLTNNGTAGRLIGGHVEGVLGDGDRIQISTDSGRTWQDALMTSDGKWMATDPNAHASSWTIQTRVVNDAGEPGEQGSVDVTLKLAAPTPSDVLVDPGSGMMRVVFDPRQVEPGSKLSLNIDGRLYDYVLSAMELATGVAYFRPPVAVVKQAAAAVVDLAGNLSPYRGSEVDGGIVDPSPQFTLDGDIGYYGGINATTFTLIDTDYFSGGNAGAHGGSNVDMLKMTGSNQLLDITAINGGATDKISDIEWIDITGSGNNTLRMSTVDVLNLGRPDAYRQDGFSQMMVTGDAGDRLELNGIANLAAGGWANAGSAYFGGGEFAVYRNEALQAEVFVSRSVAVIAESPSAPKLSMADVLGAGHQDVFQADDGERGAEARVPDGVGYTGLYSAVQDADWMMQSAMQTALAP